MPDEQQATQVMATDLIHLPINPDKGIDALLIIRSHDVTWDEAKAEKACVIHDSLGKFLFSCIKHKKQVHALIKELNSPEEPPA